MAQHALENQALTSSALRQSGMSAGLAASASKFGAAHSEKLAPHLVKASQAGVRAAAASSAEAPEKGPKPPSGLTSGKGMAGGYRTTSGKAFTKDLFTGGGPMAKGRDKPFTESLAVRQPVKVPSAPPPRRTVAVADPGLGTATALYDYEGAEVEDLPVVEGENVTVVEHGKSVA